MGIMRRWGSPWARGDALRTNHASIDVITQPLTEPVSLAEVQRHLRIDVDTETPSLEVMLVAARQKVEAFLRRALISQTIQLTLDWGPAWVELPRPPLQSVTSIVVTGLDGADVTASTATYFVNQSARLVSLRPSAIWPTHITPAGWRCVYVAGYGDTPDKVPAAIKLAILNVTAALYDNRGTLDQLVGAQSMSLRDYRVEGPPFRFAKGLEPPEVLA